MNLCITYHRESYVRDRLTAEFTVCDFIPANAQETIYHDIYLAKKKESPLDHR